VIKTHTFAGISYNIDVEVPFDGICESPRSSKQPVLRVSVGIDTCKGLKTLLHECLHACNWSVTEEVTERTACDIARLLWRLNFRRRE